MLGAIISVLAITLIFTVIRAVLQITGKLDDYED